jgi:dynein heavy chain
MQKELQELQPKLIETSKETVELIAIIETETVEVEAVKKVVEADEAVANAAAMDAKSIKVSTQSIAHVYYNSSA